MFFNKKNRSRKSMIREINNTKKSIPPVVTTLIALPFSSTISSNQVDECSGDVIDSECFEPSEASKKPNLRKLSKNLFVEERQITSKDAIALRAKMLSINSQSKGLVK